MESSQLKRISIIGLSILCLSPIEIFSNKLFENKKETTIAVTLEPLYLSNNYEIFNPNIKISDEYIEQLENINKKEENSDNEDNLESETTVEEVEQETSELDEVEEYEEQETTSTNTVPDDDYTVQETVPEYTNTVVTESPSTYVPEVNTEVANSLVNFATQFVGYPYRSGGTDLYSGVDCSGFSMKVFEQFGYSLPHSAASQANYGSYVSLDNLQPGDLIFYGYSGYISHVAIYIGNGQIVHAATSDTGIKIASYQIMPIITARRILN